MLTPKKTTWIVVANAQRCRVFEERRRGAELHELPAWARERSDFPPTRAHHEKAVQGQRFGYGQAVVNERDFAQEAERAFLARCAADLDLAAGKRSYEALILVAAPRSLGVLRDELGRNARELVERSEVCDCVEDGAERMRERVRAMRAPA
ncbi:MAG TPA: host attachment protein [Phenylobacterium sp.]|uniref:baeRF12 domain-containing protein n=1 Tax=Phenylobacterium sp. TaxID=1871053 RepID=UPI002B49371A|nr:host attachment protein [Phenylobacterium sp.]HKR87723.1 host attachment protein [Phenylobacterium sp.]